MWIESLNRLTEEGIRKVTEKEPSEIALEAIKTYLSPEFGEEILRTGIELLHEKIAGVDNLR